MHIKPGTHICLASNNKNKLREILDTLSAYDLTITPIGHFTTEEPAEDSGSYVGNATIKALAAAKASGLPALAEDSGAEYDAMDGGPGVETAPFIASEGGWERAMDNMNERVKATGLTSMRFRSTVLLAWPDGHIEYEQVAQEGNFVHPARGANGFGHDPYFIPQPIEGFNFFIPYTETRTTAEMSFAEKQATSPRAAALKKLMARLYSDT